MALTPDQQRRMRMRRMNMLMACAAFASVRANAWTPAQLFLQGEQGAWYDPSDLTTLFQDAAGTTPVTAAGQPVGRINDKSGRGNHATQSTPSSRPIYRLDGAGRGYLDFDGVDDFIATGSVNPGAIDKAQMFVGTFTSSTGNQGVARFGNMTAGTTQILLDAGSPPAIRGWLVGNTGSGIVGVAGPALSTPMVVTQLSDIAGAATLDEVKVRLNGALPAQTSISGPAGGGNFSTEAILLGFANGTFFTGRIYSFILRFSGANLDAATIAQAETWVNGKTGAY